MISRCFFHLHCLQELSAGDSACYESICEALDGGMGNPFFSHASPDFRNMVGQLRCETVHAGRHFVRINVQLGCQFAPMVNRDIAQAVFAAEFHRKFDLLDVRIGENARDVVKRGKTDAAFGADEESVILGMGVRSDD